MAYVPPKKQKHTKQIIAAVCCLLVVTLCLWGYFNRDSDKKTQEATPFTICGFDEEKSKKLLENHDSDVYTIRDYLFYGESLNLFAQPYVVGEQDDVRRKSIELYNLCSDETITYTMEESADRQIDLGELEPGFYALSIYEGQNKKRLVYEDVLYSEPFTTLRRNGTVKEVTLLADAAINEPVLSDHFLFLQVEETQPQDDIADVFIDPYGHRMLNGIYQEAGKANGLQEQIEMQEAAQLLKSELEAYGLRVVLAKDQAEDVLGYYGKDGIMQKAYASCAKYYIELGMNVSSIDAYAGSEIYYSNYASATMANALMYAWKRNTSLTPSNAYQWSERSEGVGTTALVKGIDDQQIYDAMPSLRESGGRITGAAHFSEMAKENASLVEETRCGMYALSVNFIYASNEKDASTWKKEKKMIISTMADAFAKSVHVSE